MRASISRRKAQICVGSKVKYRMKPGSEVLAVESTCRDEGQISQAWDVSGSGQAPVLRGFSMAVQHRRSWISAVCGCALVTVVKQRPVQSIGSFCLNPLAVPPSTC